MTAVGQGASQVRERRGHSVIVERVLLAAYGDRLFEQRNGALAEALPPIGEADAFEQLGADLGLQSEVAEDFRRAAIEQVLGGGLVTLRVERIGLRKHVDEECRHLLSAIALLRGCLARQFDPVVLPQGDARDDRQAQKCRRDAEYRRAGAGA